MMKVAEAIKPLYIHALKFGKEHISEESGLYHHCFENRESRDTIPFFENLCLVMALLRSHQTEVMLEGRELLSKLLPFQNKEGGFPYYLHQYPFAYHSVASLRSSVALYRIFQVYGHILGGELSKKVEYALSLIPSYSKGLRLSKSAEYLRASFLYSIKEGEIPAPYEIQKSEEIADVLLANDLLQRETQIPWHSEANQYAGPLYEEKQYQFRPMESLIDLFVGKEIDAKSPVNLHPVLLEDPKIVRYFTYNPAPWKNIDKGSYCISYLPKFARTETPSTGLHLLRLCTKEHMLVLQQKQYGFEAIERENGIDCVLSYKEEPFTDDKQDLECSLFINHQPKIDFLVNGKKGNLLYPGDKGTLTIDGIPFTLTFQVKEGEGNVVAHFVRGNRPSQTSEKVKKEWEAFDWQIAFRTLSRSEKFSLQISLFVEL
jgi:hypothetical protein